MKSRAHLGMPLTFWMRSVHVGLNNPDELGNSLCELLSWLTGNLEITLPVG